MNKIFYSLLVFFTLSFILGFTTLGIHSLTPYGWMPDLLDISVYAFLSMTGLAALALTYNEYNRK